MLTLAELSEHGPRGNAHVRVTDVAYGLDYAFRDAAQIEGVRPLKDEFRMMDRVWIPLVPAGGAYDRAVADLQDGEEPPLVDVRVILRTGPVVGTRGIDRLMQRDVLHGMIVNAIEPLGPEERRLLSEAYPRADIDACWILELDRAPTEGGPLNGRVIGGAVLLVVGVGFLLGWALLGVLQRRRRERVEASRLARRAARRSNE